MNISQFMVQLVVISVVVVGVFEIADQKLSIGGLIAITILASRAIVPIVNLSGILIRLKEIGESVNRIDEFLSLPSENISAAEAGLGKIDGKIEFKNVSYKFQNSKYDSLQNVSFTLQAGEKVGIIGQTGAGKSTIAKLILKTITPSEGSIYLDNHELSTLHPVEVRENIGIMPQDPFLFNGSIKENIGLFKPISKSKMMEILKTTGLEELIKKAGKGDGLQVGERGSNLSVGQRHLVALARALVNNPSILILDEPTTGLDIGLEKRVIEKLKSNLDLKQTLLVITHRMAALELVDRLIVINDGKIVADGPKDRVLQLLNSPQKGEI
jgi:ATP-binding cassette subfamily B protein/ATP-binding cassette subfamily C protein LapB